MEIAAMSTTQAAQEARGSFGIGLLKKAMNQDQAVASQLISKVLEGSLDPNLGKSLDVKI